MSEAPSEARPLPKSTRARMPARFSAKVVGVTFARGYPVSLTALSDAWQYAELKAAEAGLDAPEHLAALLVRNPDNDHDPNAVEVHVPAAMTESHVGHLPANLAARLAPEMDAGEPWRAEVCGVLVHPDHPDRPGISLTCWRAEEEPPDGE